MDEIYTFCGRKKNKMYIYTLKIFTTDSKEKPIVYSLLSKKLSSEIVDSIIEKFFKNNNIKNVELYSDNASIYKGSLFNFSCKKSVKTNLIESVNGQFRNYCSYLRRRSLTYAKSIENLASRIKLVNLKINYATAF